MEFVATTTRYRMPLVLLLTLGVGVTAACSRAPDGTFETPEAALQAAAEVA